MLSNQAFRSFQAASPTMRRMCTCAGKSNHNHFSTGLPPGTKAATGRLGMIKNPNGQGPYHPDMPETFTTPPKNNNTTILGVLLAGFLGGSMQYALSQKEKRLRGE